MSHGYYYASGLFLTTFCVAFVNSQFNYWVSQCANLAEVIFCQQNVKIMQADILEMFCYLPLTSLHRVSLHLTLARCFKFLSSVSSIRFRLSNVFIMSAGE